ncbi:MAG TPA: glycogen debranching N-terminal domain-containing protein [Longimicrobiales bacterium]
MHAHAAARGRPASAAEAQERKERVLTQGKPSVTRGISQAIVIKDGDVFFLSEPDGDVPLDMRHGLGLYYHDCRYLNGYQMRVADVAPNLLMSTATEGYRAVFEYTNPEIRFERGPTLPAEELGIRWDRVIDRSGPSLRDRITFRNFGLRSAAFPITISFRAEFEDVYVVRGLIPEHAGKIQPPMWKDGTLVMRYAGADGIQRQTWVRLHPAPDARDGTTVHYRITLGPRESRSIDVAVVVSETRRASTRPRRLNPSAGLQSVETSLRRQSDQWVRSSTAVASDSLLLGSVVERSLRDLRVLWTTLHGHGFFAAGVPWFVTLFGRDSIIAALEALAFHPDVAPTTLRLLASHQGTRVDDWRDEQPGKILHELRVGELAHLDQIPHTPYYGTVDATPLFLLLIARHAAWTGDLALFHELRENIDRALDWIDHYGDLDGDGYLEYRSTSKRGLVNQGWKDSGNAIVNADGSLAVPPIALVEVQGYVYDAKRQLADLFRRAGEPDRAARLEDEARALHDRFNRDFWLEKQGIYALALQAGDAPAAVVSSNPGHALWSGIAEPNKARQTAERLMSGDIFSGWGIRTLAEGEQRYNPVGYHLGTVWPHDNSIIAAGLRRYGEDDAALRIAHGILRAAMYFRHYRLPEVFAGFPWDAFLEPVRYPVACHPQAWAAGSVLHIVTTLLGLEPEAFEQRLRIVRPILPDFVDRLELHRLRVGRAHADLRFDRTPGGIAVRILGVDGELDIVVEP